MDGSGYILVDHIPHFSWNFIGTGAPPLKIYLGMTRDIVLRADLHPQNTPCVTCLLQWTLPAPPPKVTECIFEVFEAFWIEDWVTDWMPYNSSLVLDITLSTFVLPFLVSSLCAGGLASAPPLCTVMGMVNGKPSTKSQAFREGQHDVPPVCWLCMLSFVCVLQPVCWLCMLSFVGVSCSIQKCHLLLHPSMFATSRHFRNWRCVLCLSSNLGSTQEETQTFSESVYILVDLVLAEISLDPS